LKVNPKDIGFRGINMEVLGIPDPWVWGGYVIAIGLTIVCVAYGLWKWNKDED
jgi:hypothetical protein